MANLMKVFKDVARERELQKGRWGNEHDDGHSGHEWANIMGAYMGRINTELLGMTPPPTDEAAVRWQEFDKDALRVHLIKLITTGAAWVETLDRHREASEQTRRELAQDQAGEVVEGSGQETLPLRFVDR